MKTLVELNSITLMSVASGQWETGPQQVDCPTVHEKYSFHLENERRQLLVYSSFLAILRCENKISLGSLIMLPSKLNSNYMYLLIFLQ